MKRLTDQMGRSVTYLRVSLTRSCNLRCGYCYGSDEHNAHGERRLPDWHLLRLLRAFASCGISKVRFTGGEPLLRTGLVDLVRRTAAVSGISTVGLTTNGLALQPLLPSLVEAGLNRLNISLDTLSRGTFKKITGVDGFDRVYSSITAAEACRAFTRVKVNTVVMRGVNDSEVHDFSLWALERRIDLRFIEFMPTGGSGWDKTLFVSEAEIRDRIGLSLVPVPCDDACPGPAVSYSVPGAPGRVSFISAVSRHLCSSCNRLRLTADGQLLGCLFTARPVDLAAMLDSTGDTDVIAGAIKRIVSTPGFRRLRQETPVIGLNSFMRKVGG